MLKKGLFLCFILFFLNLESFAQEKEKIFYFKKGSKIELKKDQEKNEYYFIYPAQVRKETHKVDVEFFTFLEESFLSFRQMRRPYLSLALNLTLLEKYLKGEEKVPFSEILFSYVCKPPIRTLR